MQADEIPFNRAKQLFSYWARWLPAHIGITQLLQSFTTWKPPTHTSAGEPFRESTPEELAEFARALEGIG